MNDLAFQDPPPLPASEPSPGEILAVTAHRTSLLPLLPWAMRQTWEDLAFLHWPIRPDALRPLVPAPLELETFEGEAWVGVVPFRMTNVRPRGFPVLGPLSEFPELNVRTYVRYREWSGVYFFSLDASQPLAVWGARRFYFLPYFHARMRAERQGGAVRYHSYRTHRGARPANFVGAYEPAGPLFRSRPGSLEEWLTERYALLTLDHRGRVVLGAIHHWPWPLQLAEADVSTDTMAAAAGIVLPDTRPLVHFAARVDMLAWAPERLP